MQYSYLKKKKKVHIINYKQMNALINIISIVSMRNQIVEKAMKLKNIKSTLII